MALLRLTLSPSSCFEVPTVRSFMTCAAPVPGSAEGERGGECVDGGLHQNDDRRVPSLPEACKKKGGARLDIVDIHSSRRPSVADGMSTNSSLTPADLCPKPPTRTIRSIGCGWQCERRRKFDGDGHSFIRHGEHQHTIQSRRSDDEGPGRRGGRGVGLVVDDFSRGSGIIERGVIPAVVPQSRSCTGRCDQECQSRRQRQRRPQELDLAGRPDNEVEIAADLAAPPSRRTHCEDAISPRLSQRARCGRRARCDSRRQCLRALFQTPYSPRRDAAEASE